MKKLFLSRAVFWALLGMWVIGTFGCDISPPLTLSEKNALNDFSLGISQLNAVEDSSAKAQSQAMNDLIWSKEIWSRLKEAYAGTYYFIYMSSSMPFNEGYENRILVEVRQDKIARVFALHISQENSKETLDICMDSHEILGVPKDGMDGLYAICETEVSSKEQKENCAEEDCNLKDTIVSFDSEIGILQSCLANPAHDSKIGFRIIELKMGDFDETVLPKKCS